MDRMEQTEYRARSPVGPAHAGMDRLNPPVLAVVVMWAPRTRGWT